MSSVPLPTLAPGTESAMAGATVAAIAETAQRPKASMRDTAELPGTVPPLTPKEPLSDRAGAVGAPCPAKAGLQAQPQKLQDFLSKDLPPKEPLVEGLLYTGDFVSLTGRRRHGKTLLLSNLAFALTQGRDEYLGYRVPKPRKVLMFYLEDDPSELKDKLKRMRGSGPEPEDFYLYTKNDFHERGIRIDIGESKFTQFVETTCRAASPGLIVFDNLAHLIAADYNNAQKIHQLVTFVYGLQRKFNAAVLIAAHPRKASKNDDTVASLRADPQAFFEECMGSSHFINSTGSLWGIEKDEATGQTLFVGGTQRLDGTQGLAILEKDESDWLNVLDEFEVNFPLAMNTPKRQQAWELLPGHGQDFTYMEALEKVKPVMRSQGSFNPWWRELVRLRLIVPTDEGRYAKAKTASSAKVGSRERDPELVRDNW